jgi:hypothetical protein
MSGVFTIFFNHGMMGITIGLRSLSGTDSTFHS